MNALINFIMGPMVWISFIVCIGGCVFRIINLVKAVKTKEPFILSYMSAKHSIRSIAAWSIPFFAKSQRNHPIFIAITYLFHILLFVIPIFLLAHAVLIQESWNIAWPALSDTVSDLLTLVVLATLVFFVLRRIFVPEISYLTTAGDFLLILIVALPFMTGFLAYHQLFNYRFITVLHVLSGELMLILIPFTRFSHMLIAPLSRAYTGSEFGNIRKAKDW